MICFCFFEVVGVMRVRVSHVMGAILRRDGWGVRGVQTSWIWIEWSGCGGDACSWKFCFGGDKPMVGRAGLGPTRQVHTCGANYVYV